MSRPYLEKIELSVEYNEEGEPVSFKYEDEIGCGHESGPWDLNQSMQEVVNYHLAHLERSHGIKPYKRCSVHIPDQPDARCILDANNHPPKHRFDW